MERANFDIDDLVFHEADKRRQNVIRVVAIYPGKEEMMAKGRTVNRRGIFVTRIYKLNELKKAK